jgi:UDP-glucose 4-epimerase
VAVHLITGGAGFIGSHLADLLIDGNHILVADDLSNGRAEFLQKGFASKTLTLIETDLATESGWEPICRQVERTGPPERIWHLAANSDIPAGIKDATVDLRRTFQTTFLAIEFAKKVGCSEFAFSSTSAVYGESDTVLFESAGPLMPISNYGAMKAAAEACVSAFAHAGARRAWIFRFPNVIGPRSTHGVIRDLICKLMKDPERLEVLGDGTQQKPYLHVTELLEAMLFISRNDPGPLGLYNIGPNDAGVTVRFIAESVLEAVSPNAKICYTGGDRGWPGDVPKFRYDISKLRTLGWTPKFGSREAVQRAVSEIQAELGCH